MVNGRGKSPVPSNSHMNRRCSLCRRDLLCELQKRRIHLAEELGKGENGPSRMIEIDFVRERTFIT